MDLLARKEKFTKLRKRQVLLRYLGSFVTTAVVVTVAVITIAAKPHAKFVQVKTFQDSIYYQLEITNTTEETQPSDFRVVLESPLSIEEQNIGDFFASGVFLNLNQSHYYTLKLIGTGTFAEEVYDKKTIYFKNESSGSITNIALIDDELMQEQMKIFQVSVLFSDLADEYQEVYIEYYYEYLDYSEEPFVETVVLSENFSVIEIGPVYPENMILHVSLKALNRQSEVITLDEESYKIPLSVYLYGFLYIEEVSSNFVSGFAYATVIENVEILYEVLIYLEEELIDNIVLVDFEMSFSISNLKNDTTYDIYIVATYQTNTESATRQVLYQDSFTTLP